MPQAVFVAKTPPVSYKRKNPCASEQTAWGFEPHLPNGLGRFFFYSITFFRSCIRKKVPFFQVFFILPEYIMTKER